jgi:hypothetical protein
LRGDGWEYRLPHARQVSFSKLFTAEKGICCKQTNKQTERILSRTQETRHIDNIRGLTQRDGEGGRVASVLSTSVNTRAQNQPDGILDTTVCSRHLNEVCVIGSLSEEIVGPSWCTGIALQGQDLRVSPCQQEHDSWRVFAACVSFYPVL